MKTESWSQIAREEADRLIANYNNCQTTEEKIEYKQWVFEQLLNPMREGKYIGYWRNPIIQGRIAKRWNRKVR